MPVPTAITDLSTAAANNFPAGSDTPSSLDDTIRNHGAFIAQLRDGTGFTAASIPATALETIPGSGVAAATDAAAGVVELATSTETQTGTDTARAVTPAGMASVTATETRAGLVELATTTEAQTGTDTARAVTPAGLASVTATTTRAGLVELATSTEAQALSDAARAITPSTLSGAFQGGNSTLAATGFQKLPGGLILQWGSVESTSDTAQTFNFATTFPSLCAIVVLNRIQGGVETPLMPESKSTTGFTIDRSDGIDGSTTVWYFALGF